MRSDRLPHPGLVPGAAGRKRMVSSKAFLLAAERTPDHVRGDGVGFGPGGRTGWDPFNNAPVVSPPYMSFAGHPPLAGEGSGGPFPDAVRYLADLSEERLCHQ
jgi:hypothetical protein